MLDGEGYIILTNEFGADAETSVQLNNFPYSATQIVDYFTNETMVSVKSNQFSVTIPKYGAKVLRVTQ